MRFESKPYTGTLIEEEAFGKPLETLSHEEFKEKYPYIRYNPEQRRSQKEKDMEQIRSIQRDQRMETPSGLVLEVSPRNPQKPFARKLREKVAERLQLADSARARFYTAVHTPLDYEQSIDGFIDISLDNGKKVTVTYDVTFNPRKDRNDADIVFQYPGYDFEDEEDKEAFRKNVEDVARQSVDILTQRIDEKDLERLRKQEEIGD